jgi:hypothetical protein
MRTLTIPASRTCAAALLVAVALILSPSAAVAGTLPAFSFGRSVDITNSRSGLKVDVMWASFSRYQGVFLWPNNSSLSQEFKPINSGGGYFRLSARHSGQCLMLDDRAGSYRNGTLVVQLPDCTKRASNEWRVSFVEDAIQCDGDTCTSTSAVYPVLRNRATNKCLDAANGRGGRPPERAVLQVWSCVRTADDWNAGNQLFSVRNVR